MVSPEPIDALAVESAEELLLHGDPRHSSGISAVAKVWCEHAVDHLRQRLDRDLRGGEQRAGQPASDDVRVLVLLEALKVAGEALLEAAQAFKDKARLPMPANRAHQAGQRALAVHKDVTNG